MKPVTQNSGAWNYDMAACPLNRKVQLLSIYGIASYGVLRECDRWFYQAWAGLLRRRGGV